MLVIKNISDLKQEIRKIKKAGLIIGFVPTMGYLHKGHLLLVKKARKDNQKVVASIFVNPLQFGPKEDFNHYPRDLKEDCRLLKKEKVDILFYSSARELFPEGFDAAVEVKSLSRIMCGKFRPGHFQGVCTVVNKLFNLIEPDTAYFGEKDAQQLVIIKKMAEDLNMNVAIKGLPIVREADGLAMSSRNTYLAKDQRKQALVLYQSLLKAKELIKNKETDSEKIIQHMRKIILKKPAILIDYIEIRNFDTLREVKKIKGKVLVALAAKIGKTRLIDNIIVEV